ncbi:unnamed protein product [Pleuronectes platessa]|uniref:Uncharacterized protein n=1 Tax=Pleuronectes platessa TaxID=8262 RepID=A0A9N7U2N7_PLEPL|nr:unnamed protein product [Pleuronectes platessa]
MEVVVCVRGCRGTGSGLGPVGLWSSGNARPRGPHLSLLQRGGPSPGSESLLLGVSASRTRDDSPWRGTTNAGAGVSVRGGKERKPGDTCVFSGTSSVHLCARRTTPRDELTSRVGGKVKEL